MESSYRKEEEVAMSRRVLTALTVALALGLVFPLGSAMARQVDDQGYGVSVAQTSKPLVSEKTAGLYQQATQSSAPIVSEKTAGLVQPFSSTDTVAVPSTDDGFNWGDAGIGAAVVFGTMLLGTAGALTLRRHRGTLAH
jgi:hypothetical protein